MTGLLTAAQLAQFQATANASGDLSVAVQRATKGSDGMGGVSLTYATAATVTGTMAQPTDSLLQNYNYLIGALSTWLVRVPVGTDVRVGDRLLVGGQTLLVNVLLRPHSYPTALRCLASEVQ